MSVAVVHKGFLRKYGGFMFKQWKEKYLVLTVEGNLMVCRDADSPPDQVVALQSNCESIVEGKEILDLPRLPSGGRRDSCFALILPQDKFLLPLSDSPDECTQWLKLLRKVKEGVTSPLALKRQQSITPCITDREPLPDVSSDKDPSSPHLSDKGLSSPLVRSRENSFRHRGSINAAASPQPHRGCAPSLCRLSAARKQQQCPGRESGLSADGWSSRILGAGIPQLLSIRLLQHGHPRS
ncbi:uncharacterized protein LOC107751035 [Sinocyclocheilus rhinocerous]|uniref:uncharacterized protein LOC107751035 n=1 Tax=Sinocyclocheilus rhinocerous TaxID=307959 RepID=UPI0007B9FA29|nr:PREDICTED: uncharacterized protein LOC107751035 [Sinocyclocheilus rhinocerous]